MCIVIVLSLCISRIVKNVCCAKCILHMLFWKLSHINTVKIFKYPLLNNLHNKTLSSGTFGESDHIKLAEL